MDPRGWKTCEKLVAPSVMPQSRIAAATAHARKSMISRVTSQLRVLLSDSMSVGCRELIVRVDVPFWYLCQL